MRNWLKRSPRTASEHFVRLHSSQSETGDTVASLKWFGLNSKRRRDLEKFNLIWEASGAFERDPDLISELEALHEARSSRPTSWLPLGAMTAAAALVVVTVVLFAINTWRPHERHYRTVVGEQRTLPLPDHSVLHVNTNSHVSVRYSPSARRVRVHSGEVAFVVQKDTTRPFQVLAGGKVLTAVGTEFVVRQQPTETSLIVLEGKVRVSNPKLIGDEASVGLLGAGDKINDLGRGVVLKASARELARINAWRGGHIEFHAEPLSKVVQEFNSYSEIKLELSDASMGAVLVSGVFRIGAIEELVGGLCEMLDLKADRIDNRIVLHHGHETNLRPRQTKAPLRPTPLDQ